MHFQERNKTEGHKEHERFLRTFHKLISGTFAFALVPEITISCKILDEHRA